MPEATSLQDLVNPMDEWAALNRIFLRGGDVPDTCDNRDYHFSAAREVHRLGQSLDNLYAGEVQRLQIPKNQNSLRTLSVLTARDRLAYRCIVSPMVSLLEDRRGAEVRGQRIRFEGKSWALETPARPHSQMLRDVQTSYERDGYAGLVKLDVRNYFPSIDLRRLIEFLSRSKCPGIAVSALHRFLGPLHRLGVCRGLPVHPEPSSVLGTSFLSPLDELITEGNWRYFRWVDDLYVMAPTLREAERAIPLIRDNLDDLGLELSEEKTAAYEGDEIIGALRDARKDSLASGFKRLRSGDRDKYQAYFAERVMAVDLPERSDVNFIIPMLDRRSDPFAARYLAHHLRKVKLSTPRVAQYLGNHLDVPGVIDGIMGFLEDASTPEDDWTTLHQLRSLRRAPQLGGPEVRVMRHLAQDRNQNALIRAMAYGSLGRHSTAFVADVVDGGLSVEPSMVVKRGMLIGLRFAGEKQPAFCGQVRHQYPELDATVRWLKAA